MWPCLCQYDPPCNIGVSLPCISYFIKTLLLLKFSNIMFHSISCVRSCRPFVNLLTSYAGVVGCRNFLWRLGSWPLEFKSLTLLIVLIVERQKNLRHPTIKSVGDLNSKGQLPRPGDKEISTLTKTGIRCEHIDERYTGTNTINWMGRRWNLKIKVFPILILI